MILNEAQDQQNPSPPVMRKCGKFKQMLKDFYEWLEFDPNIGTAALTNTTPHTCKSTKIIFAMRGGLMQHFNIQFPSQRLCEASNYNMVLLDPLQYFNYLPLN